MASKPPLYRTVIQKPPGMIVAPNGFPADPRPSSAPKTFLDAMEIRIKVFCDEQKCAIEPELDEDDPRSWSWVVYQHSPDEPEKDIPVATVRIVPPPHGPHPNGFHNTNEEPYVKLTRVATIVDARGKGLNKQVIESALEYLASHPQDIGNGWKGLVLTHSQVYIEGFYSKMGFWTDEKLGRWDEEGIEHLGMWKQLVVKE